MTMLAVIERTSHEAFLGKRQMSGRYNKVNAVGYCGQDSIEL